jgi:hypothetical protein
MGSARVERFSRELVLTVILCVCITVHVMYTHSVSRCTQGVSGAARLKPR